MQKEIYSVQNWLPFEKILENGIIKINSDLFIKVIKVDPINFNLKSELEKEAILNSYKILLKTFNSKQQRKFIKSYFKNKIPKRKGKRKNKKNIRKLYSIYKKNK